MLSVYGDMRRSCRKDAFLVQVGLWHPFSLSKYSSPGNSTMHYSSSALYIMRFHRNAGDLAANRAWCRVGVASPHTSRGMTMNRGSGFA